MATALAQEMLVGLVYFMGAAIAAGVAARVILGRIIR
jgi:hypothetical protein